MKRFTILLLCAAILFTACRASETATATPEEVAPTFTPNPTYTAAATYTPRPTHAPAATYTPYPTYTAYPTRTPYPSRTPTPSLTATQTAPPASAPTETPTVAPVRPRATPAPVLPPEPALARRVDTDPGPPFSITVSANRAGPNSALISGFVRNDGSETYEAIGVNVTFWDDEGYRHAHIAAKSPCVLLAPGEQCPFFVDVGVRKPVSFLLHPEGRPSGPGRESIPVALSSLNLSYDALDSVRITGLATNVNPFKAKNVVVAGMLIDASGQMVRLGWTQMLREDILPGGEVRFDMRVKRVPFASYRLYAQAERDWE